MGGAFATSQQSRAALGLEPWMPCASASRNTFSFSLYSEPKAKSAPWSLEAVGHHQQLSSWLMRDPCIGSQGTAPAVCWKRPGAAGRGGGAENSGTVALASKTQSGHDAWFSHRDSLPASSGA